MTRPLHQKSPSKLKTRQEQGRRARAVVWAKEEEEEEPSGFPRIVWAGLWDICMQRRLSEALLVSEKLVTEAGLLVLSLVLK